MVTSSPSRIQVMPREMTTSQCHLLQGRRSSLAGMLVLTAFTPDPTTLLLIAFIAPRLLCSSPYCSDYPGLFAHVSEWGCQSVVQKNVAHPETICRIDGSI